MVIDILCVLVLGFGFWQGYNRGIIQVLFNVIGYVFGVMLAFKMTPTMTQILENLFKSANPLMFLAGFLVNLFFVMLVVRYAAKGLESIFEAAYMGTINQLLGGVIYGGFSVLIFSILLWFADKAMMVDEQLKIESRTDEILMQLPGQAKNVVIRLQPVLSEFWGTSVTWIDKLKNYGPKVDESKTKFYDLEDPTDKKSGGGIEEFPEEAAPKPNNRKPPPTTDSDGIED